MEFSHSNDCYLDVRRSDDVSSLPLLTGHWSEGALVRICSGSGPKMQFIPIGARYDFDYVEYMEDLTGVETSWSEDRAFVPATTVYSEWVSEWVSKV